MDLDFTSEQTLRLKSMTKEQLIRFMKIMNNDYFKALNEGIKIAAMIYPETKEEMEQTFINKLLKQFDTEEAELLKNSKKIIRVKLKKKKERLA